MDTENKGCEEAESLPITTLEAKALISLQRAIEYLTDGGINVAQAPRVKFIDDYCPLNQNIIACVQLELDAVKTMFSLMSTAIMKNILARFSLCISDEAFHECVQVGLRELDTMFHQFSLGTDADIFLYKPLRVDLDKLDEIMMHELWHHIEKEQGLLRDSASIREGTATYVQYLYSKKPIPSPDQESTYLDIAYKQCGRIIEQALENEPNPLQALLNQETRNYIKTKFEEGFFPALIATIAENSVENFQGIKMALLSHPAFANFLIVPTSENFLKAQSERGYVKLATELKAQNIEGLVGFYKQLLNN